MCSPPKATTLLPFVPLMLLRGQKQDVCGYKSKKRTCTLSKTFPMINTGGQLPRKCVCSGCPSDTGVSSSGIIWSKKLGVQGKLNGESKGNVLISTLFTFGEDCSLCVAAAIRDLRTIFNCLTLYIPTCLFVYCMCQYFSSFTLPRFPHLPCM